MDRPRYEDENPGRPRRSAGSRPRGAGLAIALVGLGIILGAVAFWGARELLLQRLRDPNLLNPDAKLREATPTGPLDAEEREADDLFKKVSPSVVNVDLVQRERGAWGDRLETQAGAGSGFIWDDDGRIVTNYHVVAPIRRYPSLSIRIVLADRSAFDAVLVGEAPDYDLAVLKFAAHTQPPRDKIKKIELGTSHDLVVGQKAYAIGNPYGLSLSMTRGIISALNRVIDSPVPNRVIDGVIQHSAAINPGNSGGPLLDKSGRLIGVNTAITSPTPNGGNVGIGFAIPADTVNQVVTEIIQSGKVLRADLGVSLFDQQKLRRARFDRGVMIERAAPGGPADQAGLRGIRVNPRTRVAEPGDLILSINGEAVNSVGEYERALGRLRPGAEAKILFERDGEERETTLVVGGK